MQSAHFREKSGLLTHNSRFEGDELLLLLLPALKVIIDQALQLNQILVLTLLMDILLSPGVDSRQTCVNTTVRISFSVVIPSNSILLVYKPPKNPDWIKGICMSTYIKVHFLTIRDLRCTGSKMS